MMVDGFLRQSGRLQQANRHYWREAGSQNNQKTPPARKQGRSTTEG